jgi:hypothetical protein
VVILVLFSLSSAKKLATSCPVGDLSGDAIYLFAVFPIKQKEVEVSTSRIRAVILK